MRRSFLLAYPVWLQSYRAVGTLVVCVGVSALVGCGSTSRAPAPSTSARTLPTEPAPAVVTGPSNMQDYRTQAARLITQASAQYVYDGQPPNPLRAIIVLDYEVDRTGRIGAVEVARFPDHAPRDFLQIAISSVRAVGRLPAPGGALANRGSMTVRETFLFDKNGRFQLMSLAQGQAAPPPEE